MNLNRNASIRIRSKRRRLCHELLEGRRLLAGPYAPAAGQVGSDAIALDDSTIVAWATTVIDYSPGTDVDAEFQTPAKSLGPATGDTADTVSLGRGGQITLAFDAPIRDGLGADFAVFENGATDGFLELGFVEVSSDGTNFFRFDNDSRTPSAVDAFGEVDPTDIHNLAGKYRVGFGTPFDLSELADVSPMLDVTAITHVRLIDIVGDGSQTDTSGDPIYDPFPTVASAGMDVEAIAVIHQTENVRSVVGFEDIGQSIAPESQFSGPDPNGTSTTGTFGDTVVIGGFQAETLTFNNAYSTDFDSWIGFAYSNHTDAVTPGFGNQYSAFAGSGAEGSATYGLGFPESVITRDESDDRRFASLSLTNTTYAALSMTSGDSFAKKFGGPTGDDPDFLLLQITGKNATGDSTGVVDFYLADFRFDDNSLDYIVDAWMEIDLSSIGDARSLEFSFTSSDVGPFGINTPTYFAIDNITLVRDSLPIDVADASVLESAGTAATTVRISRPTANTTEAIDINLVSSQPELVSLPSIVTIPVGERFVELPISPVDNDVAEEDRNVTITASATGFADSSLTIAVVDDDQRLLTLSISSTTINEGESTTATVTRSGTETSEALEITIGNPSSLIAVPTTITIEAGQTTASFTIVAVEDDVDLANETITLTASATLFDDAIGTVEVIDNDVAVLSLIVSPTSIDEPSGIAQAILRRNLADSTDDLVVTLQSNVPGQLDLPETVTILAGQDSVSFDIRAINNEAVDGDRNVTVTAVTGGFDNVDAVIMILDDDVVVPTLSLSLDRNHLSESDAAPTIGFEIIGATIADDSFNNGADLSGGFTEGPLSLNNSYDSNFGTWGGWSISNITDSTTAGYGNQYASITGKGARGSATYAIASAYPGGTVPTIALDDSASAPSFESLMITNTAYAAFSMLEGDSFAKKFGGATGDDPDYFLLTIDGLDAMGQSVGTVDFYLADFRFADNSLDYIITDWTLVDVSSLAGAKSLAFSVSSSDVGDFGINTPTYFAVDDVQLSQDNSVVAIATITRDDADLSEPLTVTITTDDPTETSVPPSVTIPSGSSSTTFIIRSLDDAVVDGDVDVQIRADAMGHTAATTQVTVEDDDAATLRLSFTRPFVSEQLDSGTLDLVVHRNTEDLSADLVIELTGTEGIDGLPPTVTIPAGAASVLVSMGVVDNRILDGDRQVSVVGISAGFASGTATVTLVDDEVAAIRVDQSGNETEVTEGIANDSLSITLASEPLSNVVVVVSQPLSHVMLDQVRLTFTSENWDTPQVINVSAIADLILEEDVATTLTFSVDANESNEAFTIAPSVIVDVLVVDYQPTHLLIGEDEVSYFVRDEDAEIQIINGPIGGGIAVTTSDAPQTITLDALTRTQGFIQIDAAGGDDTVILRGPRFTSLNGGPGFDRLILEMETPVDLASFLDFRVVGFEEIVFMSGSNDSLILDSVRLGEILGAGTRLTIHTGQDPTLSFVGEVSAGAPVIVGGQFAQVVRLGTVETGMIEVDVVSDSPWQNVLNRWDVNRSGDISSLDALVVINQLARVTDPTLPPINGLEDFSGSYFDVSGDGRITALDALRVINELARRTNSVESESQAISPSDRTRIDQIDFDEELRSPTSIEKPTAKIFVASNPHDAAIDQMYGRGV